MTITTYIDPQGKRKKGYIKSKVTHPAAGIETSAENYQKAESSPYSAYLNKGGVKQYTVKHPAAGIDVKADTNLTEDSIYARRLQKNAEDTKKNIADFNRSYADANTQLYRDYMTQKKTLPQALAAQGISGGMSETSLLGLESAYQSALGQNERSRLAGVQEIKSAGSSNELAIMENQQLRKEEKAKEEAARAAEMAKTMASVGDFSGYKALGYSDEQIAALKTAWDKEGLAEIAKVMASIGDFSGYKVLGFSDEQIAALKAAWDAQNGGRVKYVYVPKSRDDDNVEAEAEQENGGVILPGGSEIAPDFALKMVNKGLMEVVGKDENGNVTVRPTAAFTNAVKTGQNDLISGLHYRI